MENNTMEKDTQAFTRRSNLIVEIKTKQKELMINVLKQRDGRAYFLKEMERFIALSELIPKLPVSSCGTLNLKNSSIPVLQTNGRGNTLKRLPRSSLAYKIKLRYFFPIGKGKHQYCWSKREKKKPNKKPKPPKHTLFVYQCSFVGFPLPLVYL